MKATLPTLVSIMPSHVVQVDHKSMAPLPPLNLKAMRLNGSPRRASEIQALVGVKHRHTFRENYLNALIAKGWLERTISDKPKSRLQRYRTTEEGKKGAQESADPRPVA